MAWMPLAAAAMNSASNAAKTAPAGPSGADGVFGGSNFAFDNSGWNVSFPGSTISSSATKSTDQSAGTGVGAASGVGSEIDYIKYGLVLVALVALWKISKSKKK